MSVIMSHVPDLQLTLLYTHVFASLFNVGLLIFARSIHLHCFFSVVRMLISRCWTNKGFPKPQTHIALCLGDLFGEDRLDGLRHLRVQTAAGVLLPLLPVRFLQHRKNEWYWINTHISRLVLEQFLGEGSLNQCIHNKKCVRISR